MTASDDPRSTLPATPSGGATGSGSAGSGLPSAENTIIAPGQVIGGRYAIVRLLAEGGMGEVYEADDRLLRERVALKTIRAQVAHDEVVVERFKREIQLARKVTHPNVCRLFDAGTHGDLCFLTMELLEGETLDARLQSAGCLSIGRAAPLVAQMAAALHAAHRAGVIHRDFKSGNVVLVDDADDRGGTRAVVTDFGLARQSVDSSTVTGDGGIVGSPAYMAPEQVDGGAVSNATDIYALGVVMFEMVTGQLPFVAETPLATAVKRLREPPPSPRQYVPDLDERWEHAILRCLAKKPADRFTSALDVARAVGAVQSDDFTGQVGKLAPRRRGRLIAGAVLAAATLATVVTSQLVGHSHAPAATASAPVRRQPSIAVLGFKNLSGRPDTAWMSAALAEMLSTELAAGGKLRTIPGENVARGKKELQLGDEETFAPDTLAKLRGMLGSDFVLVGTYLATGGNKIRVDLRLQDTASGELVASVSENGTADELVDLVARSGTTLRDKLMIDRPSVADERSVRASLPTSPEVARLYSEGLERFRKIECAPAREELARAVDADPSFPLAHSALAAALNCLGLEEEGKQEAKKGFELSVDLPPQIRMAAEAQYRLLNEEPDKALPLYQALFASFPDSIDYGTHLAHLQMGLDKLDDAGATIAALRRLPAPLSGHVFVDLAELELVKSGHDWPRSLELAEQLATKASAQGARLMVGQARFDQSFIFRSLGRYQEAITAATEAQKIFADSGDRDGVSGTYAVIAASQLSLGDVTAARKNALDGYELAKQIGDGRQQTFLVDVLAAAYSAEGDLASARRVLEAAIDAARLRAAPGAEAYLHLNLADTILEQGDLAGAKAQIEIAVGIKWPEGGERSHFEAFVAGERALIAEAEGDFAGARKLIAEASAVVEPLGDVNTTVAARAQLARVALHDGHPAEAEALCRSALELLAPIASPPARARVEVLLADALLAQNRMAEAKTVLDEPTKYLADNHGAERFALDVVSARVTAASGRAADVARAQDQLEDAAAHAAAFGFAALALEAKLALGEVALAARQTAAGQALLASLEKEARARGFAGIARRAAHAKV